MTAFARCPSCGRVIASGIAPNDLALPQIKRRIFDAVRARPGISAEVLRGLVWVNDPNGGPEDRKVLHVHVNQLNTLLRPHGFQIRGHQTFGYRLMQCGPLSPVELEENRS